MPQALVSQVVRVVIAWLFLAIAAPAFAAGYPNRAVHMVVPFPAGGANDVIARTIAAFMSQALGQPVVVDNKPGADGAIAGEAVAKAAPDGYTLLVGAGTGMTYAPLARRQLPYDPVTSFSPIGLIGEAAFFLYVHESVPARSVVELITLARARPGALNHGSATAFSLLASQQLAHAANIQLVDVPYKGEVPMFQDLLAGRIQVAMASGGGLGHVKEGRVRIVAISLPKRSPLAPDVPTFAEAGIRPINASAWVGLFGPAGMPPETVERLSVELRAVLSRPQVRDQIERLAYQPKAGTSAELSVFVKEQLVYWRQAMDVAGIKPK